MSILREFDNFENKLNDTNFVKKIEVRKGTFSKMDVDLKIKAVGKFSSDNITLPLKVKGLFIKPGEYYTGTMTREELKKAFDRLVMKSKELLLFKSHEAYWEDKSNIDDIAGKLTGFTWDEMSGSINYTGEIYDLNTAIKIVNGLVKGISAGFTFENIMGMNKEIEFEEGTLTFRPHVKEASVEVA